jgi:hypothetical protein
VIKNIYQNKNIIGFYCETVVGCSSKQPELYSDRFFVRTIIMKEKVFSALAVILLVLTVVFLFSEIACFAAFGIFRDCFTFYEPEDDFLEKEKLDRAAEVYDYELGWVRRYQTDFGERPRPVSYEKLLISTFGDSYTHCDQVNHDQTFQTYLARKLKADVLNFGVGGYGPDQAYLRFKRDYPKVKTPIVVLGLITENINRIVNVYRRFYYQKTELAMVKPRFAVRKGGRILLPNPIKSDKELSKLRDPDFIKQLGENDWWFNRDSYPIFSFPYTGILLNKRLWLELAYGRGSEEIDDINPRPWEDLWEVGEVRELLFSIIESFVSDAEGYGAAPIIFLFPRKREVFEKFKGQDPKNASYLMSYCQNKNYNCFNSIAVLAKRANSADEIRGYYSGHLTPKGNLILARNFHRYLVDQGFVPKRSKK